MKFASFSVKPLQLSIVGIKKMTVKLEVHTRISFGNSAEAPSLQQNNVELVTALERRYGNQHLKSR